MAKKNDFGKKFEKRAKIWRNEAVLYRFLIQTSRYGSFL
jgi:hypothetical protein